MIPIIPEDRLNPEDMEGLTECDPYLEDQIFDPDLDMLEIEAEMDIARLEAETIVPNERQGWVDHWMEYMGREGSGVID